MPASPDLTRHHGLPRRYLGRDLLSGKEGRGYTGMELFKFYGLITVLLFSVAYTYIKYLDLFAEAMQADAEPGLKFWARMTVIPLVLALIALEGFVWWAAGALVDYTRWQRASPALWRWFWVVVLNFYGFIVLDPLDFVHRAMSRSGLLPAPNLILLFSGKTEWFQFQWGYFLLWLLFWFLVVVAHSSYLADGLREFWFYVKRINRYSASVLTGFRGTAVVAMQPPVTYGRERYDGGNLPTSQTVPVLGVPTMSETQAAAIVAADASGAITLAPGQHNVLLVDLGAFYWTPTLEALRDENGKALVLRGEIQLDAVADRSELVVPLVAASLRESSSRTAAEMPPPQDEDGRAGATPTDDGEAEA